MSKLRLSLAAVVAIFAIAFTVSANAKSILAACSKEVVIIDPADSFQQGALAGDVDQYIGEPTANVQLNDNTEDTQVCVGPPEEFCCAIIENEKLVLFFRQAE